jgi:hypothetical protein
MKCYKVYAYGRGFETKTKEVAAALEEISIGRNADPHYETADLISLIFELKDRIEKLEAK